MTECLAGTVPPSIRREDPTQPDVLELLRHGEEHSVRLYPMASNRHFLLDALNRPEVRFLVARDEHGKAVATGAVVLHGDWAEIKRLWVEEDARRRGIARHLLEALTAEARGSGVAVLRLETGVDSHGALVLYETAGFTRRGPFADYQHDPVSVFLERPL